MPDFRPSTCPIHIIEMTTNITMQFRQSTLVPQ
jgi:hypothetical protein